MSTLGAWSSLVWFLLFRPLASIRQLVLTGCDFLQEFLQALAIIADECDLQLIDAAVQLGADPTQLQGQHTDLEHLAFG